VADLVADAVSKPEDHIAVIKSNIGEHRLCVNDARASHCTSISARPRTPDAVSALCMGRHSSFVIERHLEYRRSAKGQRRRVDGVNIDTQVARVAEVINT